MTQPTLTSEQRVGVKLLTWIIGVVILTTLTGMFGCPAYRVYSANMQGRAELARAAQNRQITIEEANAKALSAEYLAKADSIRARGVAKANEIIGQSLRDNEAYLRYLWIDQMGTTSNQVVYIPTEAGLPILEAGRYIKSPVSK